MQDARSELGAVLRSWRDRRSPADVGLPAGGKRRASGLRREELAALAGLSVDYVVRLEQGRARHPSDQVAASLARALQLDTGERDHLYRLAGLLPPSRDTVCRHIPPSVQRLVARLGEIPIAVFSASYDLLTWSDLWAALFGDPTDLPEPERNVALAAFAPGDPPPGAAVHDARSSERFRWAVVADLRRVLGAYPRDRRLRDFIDGLISSSAEFAAIWNSRAVGELAAERKTITHPVVGPIELDCDVLNVPGSDLRIVAYTAASGTADAAKLDFLRVTGVAQPAPQPLT